MQVVDSRMSQNRAQVDVIRGGRQMSQNRLILLAFWFVTFLFISVYTVLDSTLPFIQDIHTPRR